MIEEQRPDRQFNKDVACLMEIQRLEIIANNFSIEHNNESRFRVLKVWAFILMSIATTYEYTQLTDAIDKCKPVDYHGKSTYDEEALDSLHRMLNKLNTLHSLQFTKKLGPDSAVENI